MFYFVRLPRPGRLLRGVASFVGPKLPSRSPLSRPSSPTAFLGTSIYTFILCIPTPAAAEPVLHFAIGLAVSLKGIVNTWGDEGRARKGKEYRAESTAQRQGLRNRGRDMERKFDFNLR